MPSDVFRPRLPLDPFANLQHTTPWRIPAQLTPSPPQVVFLLGQPTLADLEPLLHSPQLATSLLIIATHAVPALPPAPSQGPAIRVLRLAAPLHVHDTGALRLVGLFERAQRVAATWRNTPTPPHVLYLAEDPQGEFAVVDPPAPAGKGEEKYPSPAPSIASVKRPSIKNRLSMLSESLSLSMSLSPSPSSSRRNSIVSVTSSRSQNMSSPSSAQKPRPRSIMASTLSQLTQSLSMSNYNAPVSTSSSSQQRSFDAIVNFLPGGGLPEKALFKHAILVTTLSAQYLTLPHGADPEAASYHYHHRRGGSSPSPSPSSPPTLTLAHLSADSAPPSTSSSSCSLSGLAAPPKAQINSARQRHHHRRFSSFALSSEASIPDATATANGGVSSSSSSSPLSTPYTDDDASRASTPGLSSSTAATTPALELSTDELALAEPPKTISRRPSMKKRLSTLFAAVARPASIAGAADLEGAVEMEMGVLGESARRQQRQPRTRPQNAHIVHVLPADWVPAPSAPAPAHGHAAYNGKARAYTPPVGMGRQQKPKLVQGIEQFLLSFAYPVAGLSSSSPASARGHPHARRAPGASAPPPTAFKQGINSVNTRPASWGAAPPGVQTNTGGHLASLLGERGEESFRPRAVPYLVAPGMFGRALSARSRKGKEVEGRAWSRGWLGGFAEEDEEEEEEEEDDEATDENDDEDSDGVAQPQSRTISRRRRRQQQQQQPTLGEALLLGALDLDADFDLEEDAVRAALGSLTGTRLDNRAAVGAGRAWVGEGDVELVLVGGGGEGRVRRRRTVRRKMEVDDKANAKEKEKEEQRELGLALPTPPRSHRSSASSSQGHEAEPSSSSSPSGSGCARSDSSNEGEMDESAAAAGELHTQESMSTITGAVMGAGARARASVIAVPPRAAAVRRVSGEDAGAAVCASVGSADGEPKMVLAGAPMSRSLSSESLMRQLLLQGGSAKQVNEKEEGSGSALDVDALAVPGAVHLSGSSDATIGGGGGGGQSSTPSSTTTSPAILSSAVAPKSSDSDNSASDSGIPAPAPPGPLSEPDHANAIPGLLSVPAPALAAASSGSSSSSLRSRLSLRLKTPPILLREQTKTKVGGKDRPASMVVLGQASPQSGARLGEDTTTTKMKTGRRESFGVGVLVGNALRKVQAAQVRGMGVFAGVGASVRGRTTSARAEEGEGV